MEEDHSKFTWGDSVIILKNSPTKFHPGSFASVCGFYRVQSKETAEELEFNGEYDCVLLTHVVYYLDDLSGGLRQAMSHVKKGGSLFITARDVDDDYEFLHEFYE